MLRIHEEDSFYVNLLNVNAKTKSEAKLESHEKFIDIQIPLNSQETFGWMKKNHCNSINIPYNEEKDIMFYNDIPASYFTLQPNEFVIFFPEDAHAPLIGDGKIKKIVAKVKV